ncbi:MAG: hypothetical protein M1832_004104 [Thelocarpon impressellum]|nr:MAG: hypothetical protein M1832_004104 [Thelocarpon impressellum]
MLAARDQENLLHGRQTAAAAKQLNQNQPGKNLAPKTPGIKVPRTPFKLPLNDENAPVGLGGKTVLKTNGKGNENGVPGTKKGGPALDKNAFVTPMGPRTRAPLGLKTTNVKTKAFQTPAAPAADEDILGRGKEKTQQKSASARRAKPRVSHAETTKVEVHDDDNVLIEEEEIEYMPPKPLDLPDYPDDFPHDLEFPQFQNGNLTRGWLSEHYNPVDDDGVSLFEKRMHEQRVKADKEFDDKMEKIIDEMPLIGYNIPEFPGDETVVGARRKKEAEESRNKAVTAVRPGKPSHPPSGPSTITAKKAAALLSQEADSNAKVESITPKPKARAPWSLLGRPKGAAPTSTNPPQTCQPGFKRDSGTLRPRQARALCRALNGTISAGASKGPKPQFNTFDEWRRVHEQGNLLDHEGENDVGDENVEPGLRGMASSTPLPRDDEAEQDFVLTWTES